MIKAVIFDWSGVLCDDFFEVYSADMAVFDSLGWKRLTEEEYRQAAELPWPEFYKKRGVTDTKKISEVFLKALSKEKLGKPIVGSLETLQWLKKRKIKTAVLSAKFEKLLLEEIKQFGFNSFIEIVERHGDKRKVINDLIKKLQTKKEEAMLVGDMVYDIETAKYAGIKSVAVLSGYDSQKKLLEAKPDYSVQSIAELPALIQKLNGAQND